MLNRNKIVEYLEYGGKGLGGWFCLRYYIEHNSSIKVPTRKQGRTKNIGAWVKENLDWIAPC